MADAPVYVHLERRDDGVAVVRLDNPKVNALKGDLIAQLHALAKQLQTEPPGAVVVTGGERRSRAARRAAAARGDEPATRWP